MTFPLYLDENVHVRVAELLRRDGYDVITARDAGLIGVDDQVHLTYAAQKNRVFVTHDLKTMPVLLREWWNSGKEHAGVVLCDFRLPEELAHRLRILLRRYDGEALKNLTLWLPASEHP